MSQKFTIALETRKKEILHYWKKPEPSRRPRKRAWKEQERPPTKTHSRQRCRPQALLHGASRGR